MFQKRISEAVADFTCLVHFDDVILGGSDVTTLTQEAKKLLVRLQVIGVKFNPVKMVLYKRKVTYLGFNVDDHGYSLESYIQKQSHHLPTGSSLHGIRKIFGIFNMRKASVPGLANALQDMHAQRKAP